MHKVDYATNVARLYIAEIVTLLGVPKTIVFDRDNKLLTYISNTVWRLLGTKFIFSTSHHPQ